MHKVYYETWVYMPTENKRKCPKKTNRKDSTHYQLIRKLLDSGLSLRDSLEGVESHHLHWNQRQVHDSQKPPREDNGFDHRIGPCPPGSCHHAQRKLL